MIAKISPRMQARIKWLQPFRRTDPVGDTLWVLHELDIADKHKLLNVIYTIVERMDVFIGANPDRVVRFDMARGPIKDGTIAARLFVDPPEPDLGTKTRFTLNISFGQGYPGGFRPGVTATLSQIIDRIERIVTMFEQRWSEALI